MGTPPTDAKAQARDGSPSLRSPLPSARTKKMPLSGSSKFLIEGNNENSFVTSNTTPDPSGSTAAR